MNNYAAFCKTCGANTKIIGKPADVNALANRLKPCKFGVGKADSKIYIYVWNYVIFVFFA